MSCAQLSAALLESSPQHKIKTGASLRCKQPDPAWQDETLSFLLIFSMMDQPTQEAPEEDTCCPMSSAACHDDRGTFLTILNSAAR